jgi:hypothetical protein
VLTTVARRATVASALGCALLVPVPTHAASVTGPEGLVCGFVTFFEFDGRPSHRHLVEMDGGPIMPTDAAGLPAGGTLTCTLQVAAERHSGPDTVVVSAHGFGVVTVTPRLRTFEAAPNLPWSLCTQFTYDGGRTVYFDQYDSVNSFWSDDPDASCGLAISAA